MIRTLTYVACIALLGLMVMAPSGEPTAQASGSETDLDSRVAKLIAMPAEQRRAELKAMTPEERRGLWLAVIKARTGEPKLGYSDGPGQSISGRPGRPSRAPGAIVYDDGVVNTTFGGGAIIGNRFDTHDATNVLASGTVSTVSAVVVQGPAFSSSSAGFVLLGPQTGGGAAMAIFSTFTNQLTGVTDTVTFTGIGANYTGSSFFVLFGDFASIYVPAFGTGTNASQGYHGVVGYTGGMGPNITSTFDFGNARNGLVRASGNILPVELLSFDSDSE